MQRKTAFWLSGFLVWIALAISAPAQAPATSADAATLTVKGVVKQELRLTQAELKAMPRTKVTAKGHDGATHEYEGVALGTLLAKAGVPQGGDLRGKSMTLYLVAEAGDGYRAVFSLAELDADFANEAVIVADTSDGKELGPEQGPLRLVVPGDKRQARWVRMLKGVVVVKAGEQSN
jgi:DMSO/TMAO reductase YedYZ molybdopterin-dependent catalytic subunit